MSSRYDQRTTMFSDEGRLLQVEYAMKAVSQAPPVLGIVATDGIVIAAQKKIPKLFDQIRSGKISQIDTHIVAGICGIIADANYLMDVARIICQNHRKTFGEIMQIEDLVSKIADIKQTVTQEGGLRPYGVSFLVAGFDEQENKYKLYQTDPSGNFSQWTATSIGKSSADINSRLKTFIKTVNEKVEVKDAIKFSVRSLTKAVEKMDYNANNIEVVVITFENGQVQIKYVGDEDINKMCAEVKEQDEDQFAEGHGAQEQQGKGIQQDE